MKLLDPRTLPDLSPEAVEVIRLHDEIMEQARAAIAMELETVKRLYGVEDPHPTLTALRARPVNREVVVAMQRDFEERREIIAKAYSRILAMLPPLPIVLVPDDVGPPEEAAKS